MFYLVKYIGQKAGGMEPNIKDGPSFEHPIKQLVNGQWVPFYHRPGGDLGKFFEVLPVTDDDIRNGDGELVVYMDGEEMEPMSEPEIMERLEAEQLRAREIRETALDIHAKYPRTALPYIIKHLKDPSVYQTRKQLENRCKALDASFRAVDPDPESESEIQERMRRKRAGTSEPKYADDDDEEDDDYTDGGRMPAVRSTIND